MKHEKTFAGYAKLCIYPAPLCTFASTFHLWKFPAISNTFKSLYSSLSPPSLLNSPLEFSVTLKKVGQKSLGFSIVGGRNSSRGHSPLFVRSIAPNSIASEDGRLHSGDHITRINGVCVCLCFVCARTCVCLCQCIYVCVCLCQCMCVCDTELKLLHVYMTFSAVCECSLMPRHPTLPMYVGGAAGHETMCECA